MLLLSACSGSARPVSSTTGPATPSQSGLPTGTLTISTGGGRQAALSVEIAETETTRETGLMGRTALAPDSGMVFLFDNPFAGGFWMKDTLIPLSIAFWNADGRIVGILDMQPCKTDNCPVYTPPKPYVGAVEANLGYFAAHDVTVGDMVELKR